MPTANDSGIGALSQATGLSWVHYGFAEWHAVRRYRQSDERIAVAPGGGASNIATVAALVTRNIRGNPILGFRQKSFYAANPSMWKNSVNETTCGDLKVGYPAITAPRPACIRAPGHK